MIHQTQPLIICGGLIHQAHLIYLHYQKCVFDKSNTYIKTSFQMYA